MLIFTAQKNRVSVCPHEFATRVPFLSILAFTAFQFALVGLIFGITLSPAAITFPLFIVVLIPIRKILLKRWFGEDVVGMLDADNVVSADGDETVIEVEESGEMVELVVDGEAADDLPI
jgi:hypothetical protein